MIVLATWHRTSFFLFKGRPMRPFLWSTRQDAFYAIGMIRISLSFP